MDKRVPNQECPKYSKGYDEPLLDAIYEDHSQTE